MSSCRDGAYVTSALRSIASIDTEVAAIYLAYAPPLPKLSSNMSIDEVPQVEREREMGGGDEANTDEGSIRR